MNKKLRKLLCAVLSAAMIISALPMMVFAEPTDDAGDSDAPLVNITFDDGGAAYTLKGGATLAEGISGNALSLSGSSQYADITASAASALASLDGDFTISVWAKADKTEVWARIYDLGSGQDSYAFLAPLGWEPTVTRFAMQANGTQLQLNADKGISANEWHNIVVTRKGNVSTMYVDGSVAGSTDALTYHFSDLGTFTQCYLGKSQYDADPYFDGLIDDFAVYAYALSESEIKTMATAKYNSLIVETHFYDNATNEEIFTYSDATTVKAVSEIKNYRKGNTEFTINTLKDGGAPVGTDVTIEQGAEYVFTDTFSGADVSSYSIMLIDDENSGMAGTIVKSNVVFPDATPVDTYGTTLAAHDPSIFKDPKTGVYYAYNSGNALSGGSYELPDGGTAIDTYPIDTFTSTDLIHWYRIDNGFRIPDSATAFFNEIFEPIGSHANTDAWAPDIFYAEEDTKHPYWLYYSLSTNGSDFDYIRSAIGLVKGESPTGPWHDCGIVISSQNGDYNTNAIDPNIYEDANGDRFFIWGSFQKGIHQVPLRDDGLAEGIDYSSNAKIHSSSQKFGTRLFSTPGGIEGPEGPYMIDNTDTKYRYMFTSYGDLSINYNIRIARNSLINSWTEEMKSSAHHKLLDHMGRKVGTTYTEQSNLQELWGYKMLGSYQLGDGITYYGNGHNSVLHDTDGNWYLVEHCRKQQGGYAVLQVRKMLWTDAGWPVVSPLVYAGEKEQKIPEELIYGTWDLSSVGQTILDPSVSDVTDFAHRELMDTPVLSSEIVLNSDHTMGNNLGKWEYDGDHTVTLKFTKNGDESNYEFYKSGDTMKLFVLTGYDKDQRESAIIMTGTDQNSIANFAKKNNAAQSIGETEEPAEPDTITLKKSAGGNPILGFDASNNILYAGDPAAFVDGDTVYMIAGHDTSTTDGYKMPNWVAYSSKDMKKWKYEGIAMEESSIKWVADKVSAWASQAIKYGDKYYLYYCAETKSSIYSGKSIGVAVADKPTGPYVDNSDAPLVAGSDTPIKDGDGKEYPNSSNFNDIDPTVWVETIDGVEHRYLSWGNNRLFICELNTDMTSIMDLDGNGKIEFGTDIIEQTIEGGGKFTEAPWIYRQQDENGNYFGKYYLFYAMDWREQMAYATTDNLMNPTWKYGGLLMPPTATSNTNHPSVIDFKGKTYFIYHNGALPWGSGFRRSVCVEEFTINEDGTIDPIQETSTGLTGTASYITQGDDFIAHENFANPLSDDSYPLSKSVAVGNQIYDKFDAEWEILPGKADTSIDEYVSIQSVNKPGLYLAAQNDNSVVLTQDSKQNDTAMKAQMTFKTLAGINGDKNGVTFESVSRPGYYLANVGGTLALVSRATANANACTFNISTSLPGMLATITDQWHTDEDGLRFHLNNAMVYGKVNAYAAEFEGGKLIGAGVERGVPVTSMRQSIKIDYERKSTSSDLMLFVWNDMNPVAKAVKVIVNENPYTMPTDHTSYFEFEDNLYDSTKSSPTSATLTSEKITSGAAAPAKATYADGYHGNAVALSGSGSYGINLGKVITDTKYTVAFRMKANVFTQHTSAIFINSGDASNQKWVSAPFGYQTDGNTMIWSNNGSYVILDAKGKMLTDTWHHVAVAADGGTATLYIDGVNVGSGPIANIVTANTETYLGVNFWDTPFNGLIDDVYIYNGKTLNETEVLNLFESTY